MFVFLIIQMDVIQKDLPDALNMLEKLPNSIHETNKFFKSLIKKVNSEEFSISDVSYSYFPQFFSVLPFCIYFVIPNINVCLVFETVGT